MEKRWFRQIRKFRQRRKERKKDRRKRNKGDQDVTENEKDDIEREKVMRFNG